MVKANGDSVRVGEAVGPAWVLVGTSVWVSVCVAVWVTVPVCVAVADFDGVGLGPSVDVASSWVGVSLGRQSDQFSVLDPPHIVHEDLHPGGTPRARAPFVLVAAKRMASRHDG